MDVKTHSLKFSLMSMAKIHNLLLLIIFRLISSNNFTGELPATLAKLTALVDM